MPDAIQPLSHHVIPPRVIMDFATLCNLRCGFCPVWGKTLEDPEEGMMSLANARKTLEAFNNQPLVLPSLYGEPLLIPYLKDALIAIKKVGKCNINTNGLTLTYDLARFFVEIGIDAVMVSIDAITPDTLKKVRGIRALDRIEKAVHTLLDVRKQLNSIYPRIGVSFTVQEANREEEDSFVKQWSRIVDVVRVGLEYRDGHFPDMKTPENRVPCPMIYETMAIHNDGQVTICCLDGHKKTNMGNVFKDGVEAVWNGAEFTAARKAHESGEWDKVPYCKNCNGWAQQQYVEYMEYGLLVRKSPQFTYYNRPERMDNYVGKR